MMARAAALGRKEPGRPVPLDPDSLFDPAMSLDSPEFDALLAAAAAGAGRFGRLARALQRVTRFW